MNVPSEVELEKSNCPLGCCCDDEFVLVGRDMLHGLPGEFTVVRCSSCGLMRTDPRPTKETIGYYYPPNYGPYVGSKVAKRTADKHEGLLEKSKLVLRRLMDSRATLLPKIKPGRMLEVGCASGSFLHKMSNDGWEVSGIEFSVEASDAARALGYSVHTGPLETAPVPVEKFDLVVGWMVFEHLHEPIECLRKLSDWVRPSGWLVFSVPNAESYEFRIFKDKWYGLHLPNHLYHYTPNSIEKMLDATGWRLEKVYHQRVITNLIVGCGYVLRDYGFRNIGNKFIDFPKASGIWHYILFPLSWILSLFGQTGRMTIHASRKSVSD